MICFLRCTHLLKVIHNRLDLTVANHALLIEPQWNPMIEEQALSRVHRLRQTKRVTIVRFVIENTWEQKVITKQERKRALADLVLGKRRLKEGNDGKKQLWVSRGRITPFDRCANCVVSI